MTSERKKVLQVFIKKLESVFADAALSASKPGETRSWFYRYLAKILKTYTKLKKLEVGGKPLSRALGRNPRAAFVELVRRSSNRDPKTASRWGAALANAYQSGISSEQLPDWLRDHGGVAGRASEFAKTRIRKHERITSPEAKTTSLE